MISVQCLLASFHAETLFFAVQLYFLCFYIFYDALTVEHILHSSPRQQLAPHPLVLPVPAMLLPGHQCGHPSGVPEGRHVPLLPVGR